MGEPIATVGQLAGVCGHDGTNWRKLNLLWGFYASHTEYKENTNLTAGTSNLLGTAVPAGQVWVIESMTGVVISGTITEFRFIVFHAGGFLPLRQQWAPATGRIYECTSRAVLVEGDQVGLRIYGATAGDDALVYVFGYKMQVDQ